MERGRPTFPKGNCIDFKLLGVRLVCQCPELLFNWFPKGRLQGSEFLIGDLQGHVGKSLSINIETGRWADFATELKGGDLVSLYAEIHGLTQIKAARELQKSVTSTVASSTTKKANSRETVDMPVPTDAPPCTFDHWVYGPAARVWAYLDAQGAILHYIARYETKGGKKIVPFTFNGHHWQMRGPTEPRPLFGLDQLSARPNAPILIVEGEPSAEAARTIAPNYVTVTWSGGAASCHKADWSPLHGRFGLIWPDNDSSGEKAAQRIVALLGTSVVTTHILKPPAGKPQGWDAADALEEGWDSRNFNEWISPQTELFRQQLAKNQSSDDEDLEERLAIQAEANDRETFGVTDSVLPAEHRSTQVEYKSVTGPDSFVTRYVAYARQRTDAPPEVHELMAFGILSSLVGPKVRLPIATSVRGWPLALWVMYVVNSTVGRKSSAINFAIDIVIEVLGPDAVFFWEGSPQGFIQKLQRRDGESAVFVRDEYSGLLGQMNRGGHMAGLSQMFIRAYDGGVLENVRTRKRDKDTGQLQDDTDRVLEPYLVKMCASTWDSMVTRATIDNVLDGFLARFIVFTGYAEPRRMKLSTCELSVLRDDLIQHAAQFYRKAQKLGTVALSDEVLELAWVLEQEWLKRALQCSRPDAAGPALKRLAESVLKVAALLVIDEATEDEIPMVKAIHFEWARSLGERWIDSTMAFIDALGRTGFQQDCEAVLHTVRANSCGIKLSALYRKHRKLKKRDFDEILAALSDQDEILLQGPEKDQERVVGRRAVIVLPAKGTK